MSWPINKSPQRCPRFASVIWTLTWVQEDGGRSVWSLVSQSRGRHRGVAESKQILRCAQDDNVVGELKFAHRSVCPTTPHFSQRAREMGHPAGLFVWRYLRGREHLDPTQSHRARLNGAPMSRPPAQLQSPCSELCALKVVQNTPQLSELRKSKVGSLKPFTL